MTASSDCSDLGHSPSLVRRPCRCWSSRQLSTTGHRERQQVRIR